VLNLALAMVSFRYSPVWEQAMSELKNLDLELVCAGGNKSNKGNPFASSNNAQGQVQGQGTRQGQAQAQGR
jgi:hypothetical protein